MGLWWPGSSDCNLHQTNSRGNGTEPFRAYVTTVVRRFANDSRVLYVRTKKRTLCLRKAFCASNGKRAQLCVVALPSACLLLLPCASARQQCAASLQLEAHFPISLFAISLCDAGPYPTLGSDLVHPSPSNNPILATGGCSTNRDRTRSPWLVMILFCTLMVHTDRSV
jgi:hypothetical protein